MTNESDQPAPRFVTCPCQHCDGHIEFDANHAEEMIACPHCGLETKLYVPVPKRKAGGREWVLFGRRWPANKVLLLVLAVAIVAAVVIWRTSTRNFIIGKWQGQGQTRMDWEFFKDGSLNRNGLLNVEGGEVCNYRFIDADHIRVESPSRTGGGSQIFSVSMSNNVLRLTDDSHWVVLTFQREK